MSSDARNESNVTIFTDISVNIPEMVLDPKYLQPIRLRVIQEGGSRAKAEAPLKPTSAVGKTGVKVEALVLPLADSPSATPPSPDPALKARTTSPELDVCEGKENVVPAQADAGPVPTHPTDSVMRSPRHFVGKRKKRTTLQMLGLEDDEDNTGYRDGVRGIVSPPPEAIKRARRVSREHAIKTKQEEIQ